MVDRSTDVARGFLARAGLVRRSVVQEPVEAEYLVSHVLSIGDVFSGAYRFRLTCFQRAYAWRAPQVARLLSNLREATQKDGLKRRYCLGRLMLAQEDGQIETELVDGHQRLMTLTILLAVLRDLETDPDRSDWLHGLIADPRTGAGGPNYRLRAQATISAMFETAVQRRGATETELELQAEELSEPERNIFENREYIRSELLGMSQQACAELADFLVRQCHVIAVVVDNQDDAWSMISTEQETRLEFTDADQAKAILLSEMPEHDRVRCGRAWEGCEALLSATDMHKLLGHVRALYWRGRSHSSTPVEADIAHKFSLGEGGFPFMTETYVPLAERLSDLRRCAIGYDPLVRDAVATSIAYLTWIDPHVWVPAALQWLRLRGAEAPETVFYFRRLERLIWINKIAGVDIGVQETRYLALLDEIDSGQRVSEMTRLAIDQTVLSSALTNLRGPGFAGKDHAGHVLRRLSIALGKDSGPIVRDKVTKEHILPRNPKGGLWRKQFRTEADVKAYAQRLGNITLLSSAHNQEVGIKDWPQKRLVLASSSFVLSRDAARADEWTPRTIADRTEHLIALLFKQWDIEV